MTDVRWRSLKEKLSLKGDENQHEKSDSWSNETWFLFLLQEEHGGLSITLNTGRFHL